MPRTDIERVGPECCRVESWRRKSETDELGRLATRLRISGGSSTAAQTPMTVMRTTVCMSAGFRRVGAVNHEVNSS